MSARIVAVARRKKRGATLPAPEAASFAVVDAAYRIERSDDDWLRGVLEASRPVLDHGLFVHGWLVDLRVESFHCVSVQMPPGGDFERHVRHAHPDLAGARADLGALPASLTTASEVYPPGRVLEQSGIPPGFGLRDSIGLTALDPSGVACLLSAGLPHEAHFSARDQARWARVSAHVAAALRLRDRMRLSPETASLDAADAILDRAGTVVHRSPEVAGHEATVRAAAELLALRREPAEADRLLSAWRALVAGRWSLVDTVDSDQKRFFVLRKNAPDAPGPPPLTPVERAIAAYVAMGLSNKLIAYHLGIADSSATRAIAALCKKLGVRSRAELAQLASALRADAERTS